MVTARTIDQSTISVADEFWDTFGTRQNVFHVCKPVSFDYFCHQILLSLALAMPTKHKTPHVVERFGHVGIVHVVGVAWNIFIDAWILVSKFCRVVVARYDHWLVCSRTEYEKALLQWLWRLGTIVCRLYAFLLHGGRTVCIIHDHIKEESVSVVVA